MPLGKDPSVVCGANCSICDSLLKANGRCCQLRNIKYKKRRHLGLEIDMQVKPSVFFLIFKCPLLDQKKIRNVKGIYFVDHHLSCNPVTNVHTAAKNP